MRTRLLGLRSQGATMLLVELNAWRAPASRTAPF
jgi:hypothetical protein